MAEGTRRLFASYQIINQFEEMKGALCLCETLKQDIRGGGEPRVR